MTKTLFGFLLLLGLAGCTARADEPLLPLGSVAPEIGGKDASGTVMKLSAQKGRYVIVFFYPKDDTPGCTREACAFRDAFDKFGRTGVSVFGVSRDSETSHLAFQKKYSLPFALVADPSGEVQKAYRVPGAVVAKRVSFLVGPDGKVVKVWPNVDPATHATDVLDAIAALESKR
jgi:peroxiredoxin Q/BCP